MHYRIEMRCRIEITIKFGENHQPGWFHREDKTFVSGIDNQNDS